MSSISTSLPSTLTFNRDLGWRPFFQQQLTLEEWDDCLPARVIEQHRSNLIVLSEQGSLSLPVTPSMPPLTVGDWVLLNHNKHFHRVLEQVSIFSRKASGSKVQEQLIASNIDTLFVVCSMNNDFNLNRIERYLALANEAGVEPVVVLTKADCCDDPDDFKYQVQAIDSFLMVETVNALDHESVDALKHWCGNGKTVAFMGSSGVGKSTLINTLLGSSSQSTGSIREDDSKGRHTTTSRSLHLIPTGGLLLDTPGMRELQLADCEQGVDETFSEITALADQCRFQDCQHENEPGCAIQQALEAGELDPRRFNNYLKLMREQALNGASLAEKRAKDKAFTKMIQGIQTESRRRKKG